MVGGHHKHNGEPSEEHSGGSVQFGRDCVSCGSRGNALRIAAAATAAAATVATATAAAMATPAAVAAMAAPASEGLLHSFQAGLVLVRSETNVQSLIDPLLTKWWGACLPIQVHPRYVGRNG